MSKYEEICRKYEGIFQKYVRISGKYEGICQNMTGYVENMKEYVKNIKKSMFYAPLGNIRICEYPLPPLTSKFLDVVNMKEI